MTPFTPAIPRSPRCSSSFIHVASSGSSSMTLTAKSVGDSGSSSATLLNAKMFASQARMRSAKGTFSTASVATSDVSARTAFSRSSLALSRKSLAAYVAVPEAPRSSRRRGRRWGKWCTASYRTTRGPLLPRTPTAISYRNSSASPPGNRQSASKSTRTRVGSRAGRAARNGLKLATTASSDRGPAPPPTPAAAAGRTSADPRPAGPAPRWPENGRRGRGPSSG